MENKTTYTVAIIDDFLEEMFLIQKYVEDLPFLKLQIVESDPVLGLEEVERRTVDILILDMQMPRLNGVAFLQALEHVPVLIVCSNYTEYVYDTALYQVAYIRKTIGRLDFEKVIQKAIQECDERRAALKKEENVISVKAVKAAEGNILVDCDKLGYAEIRDKVMHFYGDGYFLSGRITMQELSEVLNAPPFMRIHKSFLVNLDYIDSFNSRVVVMKKSKEIINIGDEYYPGFKEAMKTWQTKPQT